MSGSKERPKLILSQVLCGGVDGLGTLAMAVILSYPSTALLLMEKDDNFEITEEQGSWIGAVVPGAAFFGSLIVGGILEKVGRRYVCILMSLLMFASWAGVAVAVSAYQVIAARVVAGFCVGINQVGISIYVSETVNPKLRPLFSVLPAFAWIFGFLITTTGGDMVGWRGSAWIGGIASLAVSILLLILPETPYFLLKLGKPEEARQTLKWLNPIENEAFSQFEDIKQSLSSSSNEEKSSNFFDMLKPPYAWPFIMGILLHIFQQATGITAITTFMGQIIARSDSLFDIGTISLAITTSNIGAIFLSAKMLDQCSRKKIISVSSQLTLIPLLLFSAYLWARENNIGVLEYMTWIPFVAMAVYCFGFSIGWGPIPWIFIAESLPLKIRGPAAGFLGATNWAFGFITTKCFSWASVVFGTYGILLIFAMLTCLGMIVSCSFIPETFGFSDSQLEKYYSDASKKKTN